MLRDYFVLLSWMPCEIKAKQGFRSPRMLRIKHRRTAVRASLGKTGIPLIYLGCFGRFEASMAVIPGRLLLPRNTELQLGFWLFSQKCRQDVSVPLKIQFPKRLN
jgi:hypothetical protein